MLTRLVAKLLFKACVPLIAVAGMATYGVYLKGGDPASLWKHLASGSIDQAANLFTKARDDAGDLATKLTAADNSHSSSGRTQVYTWVDENGQKHFGTTAPAGMSAQLMSIDPNVNVLAPVRAPTQPSQSNAFQSRVNTGQRSEVTDTRQGSAAHATASGSTQSAQAVRQLEEEMGEPLPGIAGKILSTGRGSGNALDPSQLIQLIQSAGAR